MSYTLDDIRNSEKYADYNLKVRLIKALYDKAPHLTSKLTITTRAATHDDFYIPLLLQDSAFIIDIKISERLCDSLSCNAAKEKSTCKPEENPSYYRVGTDAFDVQCQAACWHTAFKGTYNAENLRIPDTPRLHFHEGACRLVPPVANYLEKPFYRSDVTYEMRVNDMPTGYTRIKSDNPYGSGYTYKNNEQYCKYYDRIMLEDESCSYKGWEKFVDAVVGMSLINAVKSSVRIISNGKHPFAEPEGLPKYPDKMDPKYLLDGWKNDIDKTFKIPEIKESIPSVNLNYASFTHERHNEEAMHVQALNLSPFMLKRMNLPVSEKKRRKRDVDEKPETSFGDKMKNSLLSILEGLTTDKELWKQMGIGIATDVMIAQAKKLSVKLIEKLTPIVLKNVVLLGERIGAKVLGATVKSLTTKLMVGVVTNLVAKSALMLAKMISAAASVAGWILFVSFILDLVFTFWDPFGYSKMFPANYPRDLMANAERAFRSASAVPSVDFEFKQLVEIVLPAETIQEINLQSMLDQSVYLDALIVNSEGSRIDKGELITHNIQGIEGIEDLTTKALAKRVKLDVAAYEKYNKSFFYRNKIQQTLNMSVKYVGLGTIAVSLCLQSLMFLFVGLIIAVLILYVARLNITENFAVNVFNYLKYGKSDTVSLDVNTVLENEYVNKIN